MMRRCRLWVVSLLAAAPALGASAVSDGFSVSVLVDGAPAPEYASRGRIYIEALKGREFAVRLSNPTAERVAVALSVDGRNVVDARRTTALAAVKWILAPGQTVEIPGWQVSGSTSRRFFFTETSKSYAKWLGDTSNVGTIEAVFFREKRREPMITWKDAPEASTSATGRLESRREAGAAAPSAPREMKAQEADNFAATGIGDRTPFAVEWVAFDENPTPAARIALRYEFRPQLVRLGVLPSEEDLFARDRSRGFEHAYAPDPGRNR